MSRLAKKPLKVPAGVVLSPADLRLSVKGPKGELFVQLPRTIEVGIGSGSVSVKMVSSVNQARADAGTVWSLIKSAMEGVENGFRKVLEIEGVGYRASMEGNVLVLSLGYVHPVRYEVPAGVQVSVEKNTISVNGIDKQLVGQVAAKIRAFKKPEPYKGKGIRYQGEIVRRKVGKKAAATAG